MRFTETYILAAEAGSRFVAGRNHRRRVEKSENICLDDLRLYEFELIGARGGEGSDRKAIFLGAVGASGVVAEKDKSITQWKGTEIRAFEKCSERGGGKIKARGRTGVKTEASATAIAISLFPKAVKYFQGAMRLDVDLQTENLFARINDRTRFLSGNPEYRAAE